MNFTEIKKVISSAANEAGIVEYDVFYSEAESLSADALKNEIDSFNSNNEAGISFRCIVDGKFGQASTERIEKGELEAIVQRAKENATYIESDDYAEIYNGSPSYPNTEAFDFVAPNASFIKEKLLEIQGKAYNKGELVADGTQSGAGVSTATFKMFNSYGLEFEKHAGAVQYYSNPVLSDGDITEDGFDYRLSLDFSDVDAVVEEAFLNASNKINASLVDSGNYDIIFSGKRVITLLSEFCGAFSAKNVKLNMSMLKDKIEETVASELVTIVDDPLSPDLLGKNSFDAEGVATYKKSIIEKGVLKTYLHDLSTANYFGVQSTGNSYKGGYQAPFVISPYFLSLEAGDNTFDELLAEVKKGIYVTELISTSGNNAVTGDFSIESMGFLIEDGKIGRFVKSFTVAGNFFDLLKNIAMISDRREVKHSGLFKGYSAPDILVKNMSVAGK